MLRIDPELPMLRIDPALPMLRMDPALPRLKRDRTLMRLPKLKRLNALSPLATLSRLRQLASTQRCYAGFFVKAGAGGRTPWQTATRCEAVVQQSAARSVRSDRPPPSACSWSGPGPRP